MFSWPLHDGRRFAGSSAEGGWTVTLHRRNKPNTCHRADFQQLEVQRGGAYVTRRRTHLLFCIQTGKRWRYCHENSETHLGFCCLYLLNCPDNSLEVSWGISCTNCNFYRRFFGITDTPQKWDFKRLELYKLLWFYEKVFWRISEFKARAVLTETVRNVTITSHLSLRHQIHGATDRLSHKTSKSGEYTVLLL